MIETIDTSLNIGTILRANVELGAAIVRSALCNRLILEGNTRVTNLGNWAVGVHALGGGVAEGASSCVKAVDAGLNVSAAICASGELRAAVVGCTLITDHILEGDTAATDVRWEAVIPSATWPHTVLGRLAKRGVCTGNTIEAIDTSLHLRAVLSASAEFSTTSLSNTSAKDRVVKCYPRATPWAAAAIVVAHAGQTVLVEVNERLDAVWVGVNASV